MKKEDWEAGYQAGVKRESSQAPRQFDALSWQSGYIEARQVPNPLQTGAAPGLDPEGQRQTSGEGNFP